jgi:streptomycin 6-kinase
VEGYLLRLTDRWQGGMSSSDELTLWNGDSPASAVYGTLPVMFSDYIERWALTPDGDPITTNSSRLLPVRRGGVPTMLKIAALDEENRGGALMNWWNGHGAARVLAHAGNAILMDRAENGASLADFARDRRDDEASRIICAVLARLHAPRDRPAPCR